MKQLVIYTLAFPFGTSEQSFLSPELQHLSKAFDRIYILPLNDIGNRSDLPPNVELLSLKNAKTGLKPFVFFYNVVKLLVSDFPRRPALLLKNLRVYLQSIKNLTIRQSKLEELLCENLNMHESVLHYSYWLSDWASVLALSSKLKNHVRVSRVHGFDLYEERAKHGFQFFRNTQLKSLDSIYSISAMGMRYLHAKHPQFASKIKLARLGSPEIPIRTFDMKPDKYRVHSCSSLIPLKRVHLIIDTLGQCKARIHWTHAGSGPLADELMDKAKLLPQNVTFEFLGQMKWSEIRDYYSTKAIDIFIHLSETEGVPVAIMEAISVGIPVFACDVGGVSEVIPKGGCLLDVKVEPKELAARIDNFLQNGDSRNKLLRESIIRFWKENYSADTNFELFTEALNQQTVKP